MNGRSRAFGAGGPGLGVIALLATACGLAAPAQGPANGLAQPESGRTLTVAVPVEPKSLIERGVDPLAESHGFSAPSLFFSAGLTQQDEKLEAHPYLARSLPKLNTDTWKVLPDGRMETIWHLRPDLTWHDGVPIEADDFVFSVESRMAWKTQGGSGRGGIALATLIDQIAAPDSGRITITWKTLFPLAGESDWQPIPRHILGQTVEGASLESVANLPYWNTDFVGTGPFHLDRWERGAFITGSAFPGYVHGLPRIARLQLVWLSDKNTAVAQLLAGSIDLAADGTVAAEQTKVLKREWAASDVPGTVLLSTDIIRYVTIQFKAEYTSPAALLDLRVRQALAHSIDKQALVDGMVDGEPAIAETGLSPQASYFPELGKILTKYPYDLRRAEQLMGAAGFIKDTQGFYSQSSARLRPDLQEVADGVGEREAPILSDGWKRAGVDVPLNILSPAQNQDAEIATAYPALKGNYTSTVEGSVITEKFPSRAIATAANKWVGTNRSGYSNPEYDRLYQVVSRALDPKERDEARIQADKILSDDAAYFPLYYFYNAIAHRGQLLGPRSAYFSAGSSALVWQIEDWRWQAAG